MDKVELKELIKSKYKEIRDLNRISNNMYKSGNKGKGDELRDKAIEISKELKILSECKK